MPNTILITGASSGFGEACAHTYAKEGNALILIARRKEKLEELQTTLSKKCPVHIAQVDVRDKEQVKMFFKQLPKDFQNIDVLINNAGLALGINPANTASLDDWETMVDTNIKGLLYMTKQTINGMIERNHGHIINVGSTAASWPYIGSNAYGASKAFVKQFSRNLRADLLGTKVRVSHVDPGLANTNFSNIRLGDDDAAEKVYEGTTPLSAQDVADTIYWVSSVPPHVNINYVEVMPVCQAVNGMTIDRTIEM